LRLRSGYYFLQSRHQPRCYSSGLLFCPGLPGPFVSNTAASTSPGPRLQGDSTAASAVAAAARNTQVELAHTPAARMSVLLFESGAAVAAAHTPLAGAAARGYLVAVAAAHSSARQSRP
jgi:hypothetical protein